MKTNRTETRSRSRSTSRRAFLKDAVTAGGGLLAVSVLATGLAAETAPAGTSATPAPNDTIKTLRSLRTIHGNFTDREIPEDTLQTIIQSSVRAANASNMQNYSIIVVRDRAVMQQVCGYRGSRMLVFCADHNRAMACAASLGHTYKPDDITNFVTAAFDTAIAAQTAAIAARSLGIDYLLTNGVHRGDMGRHWKLLELPETQCFPLIALVLGYPTQEPAALKGRYDGPGIVHEGKYHRPTAEELAEMTRRYDDPAAHLALVDDWAAHGHKHYFDWLFKEWVGRSPRPAGKATQILEVLKRTGYVEA
jgi:nitroreductase